MKRLRTSIEFTAIIILFLPFAILPMKTALKVGELLGTAMHATFWHRRRMATENIRQSLPFLQLQPSWNAADRQADAIARKMFQNFGRSLVEIAKIYFGLGAHLIQQVEFRGIEHLEAAQSKGRGVMLVTGHCGNWELLALAFGSRVQPVSSIARPIASKGLHTMLDQFRRRHGNRIIYKQGALKSAIRELKKNGIVAVLMDQAVSPRTGVLVPFLGRTAWMTRTPTLLARKTGAPIVPVFGHREDEHHIVTFCPEVSLSTGGRDENSVALDAEKLTHHLESYISHHPDQWFWVHNRWKRAGKAVGKRP